jgi:hypothetical protein
MLYDAFLFLVLHLEKISGKCQNQVKLVARLLSAVWGLRSGLRTRKIIRKTETTDVFYSLHLGIWAYYIFSRLVLEWKKKSVDSIEN